MNDAKKLYQLQEIDLDTEQKQEALAKVVSRLGDDSQVREAVVTLEQARQWLKELERAQRAAEADAEDVSAKLDVVGKKLYGGKVTNLKELSSLQEEFEQLKSKLRQKEDLVLGVMGEVDAAQKSLKVQEQRFKEVEAQWHQEQETLTVERSVLQTTIAQLIEKREKLAVEIDSTGLKLYEGLRKATQGKVLARVEQGRCQGCRLSLSISELKLVRSPALVQCSSCHRILFLD